METPTGLLDPGTCVVYLPAIRVVRIVIPSVRSRQLWKPIGRYKNVQTRLSSFSSIYGMKYDSIFQPITMSKTINLRHFLFFFVIVPISRLVFRIYLSTEKCLARFLAFPSHFLLRLVLPKKPGFYAVSARPASFVQPSGFNFFSTPTFCFHSSTITSGSQIAISHSYLKIENVLGDYQSYHGTIINSTVHTM